MGLSNHTRRQVEKQASEMLDRAAPQLSPQEHRVLTALLARTAEGWHVFVRDSAAGVEPDAASAFLIGPGGVFAVLVTAQPPDSAAARATLWHAEKQCQGISGPGGQVLSAIHLVVIQPEIGGVRQSTEDSRLYRLVPESSLPSLFSRQAPRLDRSSAGRIAEQAAKRLQGYRRLRVTLPERTSGPVGMFDEDELTVDQVEAAQRRPFASWLTFLHPHQQALVTRDYGGPARISGPAGTGKSVVALYRLRHLARRTTGPLLFTTFVSTLPTVQENLFRQLAPELDGRVEFTNLHAWIRSFLESRGRRVRVNHGRIQDAFGRAWMIYRDALEPLEQYGYWQTEVDRVIKGRGVRSRDDYVTMVRRGRTLRLDARTRAVVWQLYETYQDNLRQRNEHDFNDMIEIALAELVERPLDKPYGAVVVDEVQDITLVGLRFLHQLAGVGRNRLLLVGDGQQQVYPGGWRLSDAGIPVQGRGEVLRVNYRNRARVLEFAQRFDARNQVDDLDGGAGVALRDVELANSGGQVERWQGSARELPGGLMEAVRALPVPVSQTALIVFQRRHLDVCEKILHSAGISTLPLENYRGTTDELLKTGTVHRAKGLDFQAVLVVQFVSDDVGEKASEQEHRDLRGRQHLVAATRARDFLWWGRVVPD